MEGFITLAASNSALEMKNVADIVCEGKNDEKLIQSAVYECIKTGKNLYFFNGKYEIDAFYEQEDRALRCAIFIPNCKREIAFVGQNLSYGRYGENEDGVVFHVTAEALETVSEQVDVLRTTWTDEGLCNGSVLKLQNLMFTLSHNQKPVRCIDLRRCDRPEVINVKMNAFADMKAGLGNPPPIAAEGCIGLTMTDGSNNSFSSYTHVYATGFYEGIQVGGEHVVMTQCGALMNFYGYTFGNYEINCGANHPIVMIECMDERNVNLPLFNKCGDHDGKGHRMQGEQEVTMVSLNIERLAAQTPGGKLGDVMREVHPGTWRGNIEFSAQPAWCHLNEKHFQLWENDGSGSGFKTRNSVHKLICTTEERLSYYPMLAEQIFDTDLNKMVICIDPEKKKWVDFNGNEV
jgi:hypothetical protein